MADPKSLEALEQRLNHITHTLIAAQQEIGRLRSEIQTLRADGHPASSPLTVEEKSHTVSPTPVTTAYTIAKPTVSEIPKSKIRAEEPKKNIEAFIGGKLLTIIGIVVLVIGLGILVIAAIEADMIGPIGRIMIGILSGLGLSVVAKKLKRTYELFSAALLSGGMATLYFSVFTAFSFYALIPQWAAFVMMLMLTIFTVLAATRYDRQIIGVMGLVGAYGVPFLISTQSGQILILLSYITLVNAGILILGFRKNWRIMNHTAFVLTWAIFTAWLVDRYDEKTQLPIALGFSTLFYIKFYLLFIAYKIRSKEPFAAYDIIRLLGNSFVYYGVGYGILDSVSHGAYQGLFTMGIAATHIAFGYYLRKTQNGERALVLAVAGMTLIFTAIAIVVQLEGHWVTMLWLAVASVVFWMGRSQNEVWYVRMAVLLYGIGFISFIHDQQHVVLVNADLVVVWKPVFNLNFLSALWAIGAFAFSQYIIFHPSYVTKNAAPSQIDRIGLMIISGLTALTVFFAFAYEIHFYFQSLYRQTYTDWHDIARADISYLYYNTAWISLYAGLFLYAFTVLSRRFYKDWKGFIVASVLAGFYLILVLTQTVDAMGELRSFYIAPPGEYPFVVGFSSMLIRFGVWSAVGLLLYGISSYAKAAEPKFSEPLHVIINICVIIILSVELKNAWLVTHADDTSLLETQVYRIGFTILFGIYSLTLIAIGIWKRHRMMRYFAIALFALTLVKIYTYDMQNLSSFNRILLFIPLGLILLLVSFLYQKFKHIITGDEKTNA